MLQTRRMLAALAIGAHAFAAPVFAAPASDGSGLQVRPDSTPWPRLQARLLSSTVPLRWEQGLVGALTPPSFNSGLLGDYYLSGSMSVAERAGGFRATTGFVPGSLARALAPTARTGPGAALTLDRRVFGQPLTSFPGEVSAELPATPYLGFGYTGLSARSGWSFSADLGLVSRSPGSGLKLGSVLSGSQSLDEKFREMRWAPVLQLGIQYAF